MKQLTLNFQNATEATGEMTILSSPVDFHASHSPSPENEKEQTMTVTSGRKCFELYERLPRVASWQKTLAALFLNSQAWHSKLCSLTWKMKGTKYNRLLFQLVPLELRTVEIGFGLSRMLPTPRANDMNHSLIGQESFTHRLNRGYMAETVINQFLQTPTAADSDKTTRASHQDNLNKTFQTGGTSLLNPLFVTEMMGYPTDWPVSPFQDGDVNP